MPDHVTTSKLSKGEKRAGASADVRDAGDAGDPGAVGDTADAPEVVLRATRPDVKPPERGSRAATARALVEAFDMIVHFARRAVRQRRR